MLINNDRRVFVAERIDTPGAWQMPQGGLDEGESPAAAALRELEEEIGTRQVEILAESREWLTYDLPAELRDQVWGGRYRGQKQKWFLCRFTGTDGEIALDAHSHPEFRAWRWVEPEVLPQLIVPFKRDIYRTVLGEFHSLLSKRPAHSC